MNALEKVKAYYNKEHHFKTGIQTLRKIAFQTQARETYKWSTPVYTLEGKNVFWISRFKHHFGVGFFNGSLLKDPDHVLVNVQEGKTQAMRHWKFYSNDTINEKGVMTYMKEALDNQKKGKVPVLKKKEKEKTKVPQLLKNALKNNTKLNDYFQQLSPYRQKEYAEYVANAKQEKTRVSRLEKILPMISKGIGLNDKYR